MDSEERRAEICCFNTAKNQERYRQAGSWLHTYVAKPGAYGNDTKSAEMKILYLPLKKEWYEMIEAGKKPVEYREITTYWAKRLILDRIMRNAPDGFIKWLTNNWRPTMFKRFDAVRFSYGYTKRAMTFECKSIGVGFGYPIWGAPRDKEVFVIALGKRLQNETD